MTNELMDALAVLAASSERMEPAELAGHLLSAYPPKAGETRADALCRLQAEVDELLEGVIGAVWTAGDLG